MSTSALGVTFSHPHLLHLGIPVNSALLHALAMGFSHIRLGIYWNRVEKNKNIYDFGEIEKLLEICEKEGQKIIINVGMKSPRWPEFYIPHYITNKNIESREVGERALVFIEKTINKLKTYQCITHWQVENEPLDPSGPFNLSISSSLLKQEVDLVRSLDNRPIIITLWGNEIVRRNYLAIVFPLADVIGLDIYYKQHMREILGNSLYSSPQSSDVDLNGMIQSISKPIFITELQAEPWEKDEKAYLSENPKSISPLLLRKNIQRALSLGAKEILLWGFEYWYLQMMRGDSSYMKVVKEFCCYMPSEGELAADVDGK